MPIRSHRGRVAIAQRGLNPACARVFDVMCWHVMLAFFVIIAKGFIAVMQRIQAFLGDACCCVRLRSSVALHMQLNQRTEKVVKRQAGERHLASLEPVCLRGTCEPRPWVQPGRSPAALTQEWPGMLSRPFLEHSLTRDRSDLHRVTRRSGFSGRRLGLSACQISRIFFTALLRWSSGGSHGVSRPPLDAVLVS